MTPSSSNYLRLGRHRQAVRDDSRGPDDGVKQAIERRHAELNSIADQWLELDPGAFGPCDEYEFIHRGALPNLSDHRSQQSTIRVLHTLWAPNSASQDPAFVRYCASKQRLDPVLTRRSAAEDRRNNLHLRLTLAAQNLNT
jgi:hypothetical protein